MNVPFALPAYFKATMRFRRDLKKCLSKYERKWPKPLREL